MHDAITLMVASLPGVLVVVMGLFVNNRGIDNVNRRLDDFRDFWRQETKSNAEVIHAQFDVVRADIRLVIDKLESLSTLITRMEERRA